MSMSVYWIHHPDHTDMFTQGYIGITSRFKRRMFEHKRLSTNQYLINAINKYGWNNLIKEVILIADKDYCINVESQLRNKDAIGWNLVKGGNIPPVNRWNKGTKGLMKAWNKGKSWSEEQKQQISDGVKKLWADDEYRQHMSNAHKGKPSGRKGKKHTEEAILKMSLSKKGRPSTKKDIKYTQEQKDNLSKQIRATSWTCPHCNKIGYGIGAKNRWHFNNCKQKGI